MPPRSQSVAYRSCIAYVPARAAPLWVAVGPSGTDYSPGDGMSWFPFSTQGFHTVAFNGSLQTGWASGADGRVARFSAVYVLTH
ncbi:MAG: hypothetical protein ACE5JX_15875 [Acidobacteriota bacterium]